MSNLVKLTIAATLVKTAAGALKCANFTLQGIIEHPVDLGFSYDYPLVSKTDAIREMGENLTQIGFEFEEAIDRMSK